MNMTIIASIQKFMRCNNSLSDEKYKKLESQQQCRLYSVNGQESNDCTDIFSLPQYIRVMVSNYQPLQTVFAIDKKECHMREIRTEEQFSSIVTIVDTATQQTLECVLLLHGEKPPKVNYRTLFCYIAVQVSYCDARGSHPYPLYHVESKPCKQGKLSLTFCFHQPGTACVVQLSIHSMVDSEGVEYMYDADDCTCVVQIIDREEHRCVSTDVHGVERVKEPPLIRYTGSLATANYHKLAKQFEKLSPKAERLQQLASKITRSGLSDDIKVIALCWEALIDIQGKPKYNEGLLKTAWDIATKVKCGNGMLLQGRVLRHWAHVECVLGNYGEALDYISSAKQRFVNAAHSNETASVIYTEILVQWRRLSSAPLPMAFTQLYESTERNYDSLLKHSEFMEEYEKYRVYLLFTEKAKLHLRSVLITDELPSEEYRPREDDLKKAELCLKNAPLHEKKLPDQANNYKGNYYLTLSDLHLWKKEYPKAMEYAKQAKEFFTCGPKVNLYIERAEKRLKLLKEKQQEEEEYARLFEELSGDN